MTMGQEKSDDLVVPEDLRKQAQTAPSERGGKEVTASEDVEQLELFRGTADSPQGVARDNASGRPAAGARAMPKPRTTMRSAPRAMTIEEIADETNLLEAFVRVASNKGAPGPDGMTIAEARKRIHEIVRALHVALLEGSYRPGNILRVWIPKPGGEKRGLGIPNVVDRLVQQAVHNVLSPHFEPKFHEGSHGFRPGRSCHTAITAAKSHLEKGYGFVVDIDLEKFFDRVHHERLLARLQTMGVRDLRVVRLVRQMLEAKVVMPDGVVVSTEEGTPQGGPLSPLLSNIVLDELDREIEQRGHRFVRYADDCNIYVRSERAGQRVMESITRFIERRLRLKVNRAKSAVARPGSWHFVGFSLRRSRKGAIRVHLSKRSKERIARKVVELTPRNWGGSLDKCIKRLNEYLVGWIGFFHVIDDTELFGLGFIDAHIRRRLRAIVFRQKKRRRYIVRWLQKRRVPLRLAKSEVYGQQRSLWALSITKSAHKAMSSYWFDRQGLLRLERLWRKRNKDESYAIAHRQLALPTG
jgi:group II intron reverse transcriptase/maturase